MEERLRGTERGGGRWSSGAARGGGWAPVLYQHQRSNVGLVIESDVTVFVDNLSESMNKKDLFKLFFQFGVVKDAFIPAKRRRTPSRFGFVCYDCSVEADMAVLKANGNWCDDKALNVKLAEYGKDSDVHVRQERNDSETKSGYRAKVKSNIDLNYRRMPATHFARNRSYIDTVKGITDQYEARRLWYDKGI